ncbi:unnamed protein product [Alopecurus aequalis]
MTEQVDLRFWGVAVKPGETVKCDPGELYYHVSQITLGAGKPEENVKVFVNIDDKSFLLGTLSADNDPNFATSLVFEKKFELLHSSKTSNIYFTGYTFNLRYNPSTKGGDESDEEVPLLIPLESNKDGCKNNEATHGDNKLTAPRPADAPSSITKARVEEPTSPGNAKGDDKKPSDGDNSESSEDGDYPRKKTKGKNEPVETPLKTPRGKKAKIATPTTGKKTGYVHVATPYPAKQAQKTSGYVHVATPHPAKRPKKATGSKDRSTQSTPHVCGSCSRTFSSPISLKDHSKVKHGVAL